MIADIRKELAGLESTPQKLRSFGMLMGGVLAVGAAFAAWKGRSGWIAGAAVSGFFFLAGALFPSGLRQLYRIWMLLAMIMGWFMTRVVLTAAFALIMTPIGLLLRLAGKDLLDLKIDKGSPTYWKRHERAAEREDYTKQF